MHNPRASWASRTRAHFSMSERLRNFYTQNITFTRILNRPAATGSTVRAISRNNRPRRRLDRGAAEDTQPLCASERARRAWELLERKRAGNYLAGCAVVHGGEPRLARHDRPSKAYTPSRAISVKTGAQLG